MDTILFKIQDTVSKYANIISQIAKVDVEVMDDNLFRVAGTGIFKSRINQDMSNEGFIYSQVLKTGKRSIVTDPGNDPLCFECPNRNSCNETFEISMPIVLKGDTIGVLGMMSSDVAQRAVLSENLSAYLELLEQIADFISLKAFEYVETKELRATLEALDCVTTQIEQGVLMIGPNDILTGINAAAKKQLDVTDNILSTEVSIYSTGDIIEGFNEYHIRIGSKEITVIGKLTKLQGDNSRFCNILIFSNISTLSNRINSSAPAVNPLAVESIIGISENTQRLRGEILKISKSTSTVLITGESGTGKEMVATAIWKASDRANERFVAVNCGAIPEALLESELFGYVKGAFTGADSNGRMGKFELANNGVIFLDEIGDMPLYLQVKLLRVLQERKIVRIGSNQLIPLNIRVIAATNKDLKKMIEEKKFRDDLFYRLNVIPLHISPLRERQQDIDILAHIIINRYSDIIKKKFVAFTPAVLENFRRYSWPGNVRELENVAEFMVNMMNADGILDIDALPTGFFTDAVDENTDHSSVMTLDFLEKREIEKALDFYGSSTSAKKQIAEKLGVGIATLYRKLEKYKLN